MEQAQQPKRGLSALLASTTKGPVGTSAQASASSSVVIADIPVGAVRPNPSQPRMDFDPSALAELAASIKAQGLIQPIVVRKLRAEDVTGQHQYELIAGERRWRAAQTAGLANIPAIIKAVFSDKDVLLLSLVENLQRADLNPLEEALAYDRLAKIFGLKHDEIADAVGKSRSAVSNTLRILELPATVQEAVQQRRLTLGHAMVLLSIPDAKLQSQLAAKAQAENLTIRDLERIVAWQQRPSRMATRPDRQKGTRQTRMAPPDIQDAERRLREHFGTRVTIEEGIRKGRIVIEFYSADDFQRITKLMHLE